MDQSATSLPARRRLAFSTVSFTASPTAHLASHAAILAFRNIRPRFNTRLQFNNQDCNIVHAVQSKSSLANRRGFPHAETHSWRSVLRQLSERVRFAGE